jgi:hypothetical protein
MELYGTGKRVNTCMPSRAGLVEQIVFDPYRKICPRPNARGVG